MDTKVTAKPAKTKTSALLKFTNALKMRTARTRQAATRALVKMAFLATESSAQTLMNA